MTTLSFDLSQTSVEPGWTPGAAPHDFYWQNFLTGYSYTTETDPGTVQTGTTADFSSDDGDVAIMSATFETNTIPGWGGPAITVDWTGTDDVEISLLRNWNVIKNIEIDGFTGHQLTVTNFVDVWIHVNEERDQSVTLNDVKRAEVSLGSGDDLVTVNAASNGDIWTNHFTIKTGAGDDTITIANDGTFKGTGPGGFDWAWVTTQLNAGSGDDTVNAGNGKNTVFGGDGDDTIVSGYGADKIDGGDGADVIHGGGGNDWISAGSDTDFYVNELHGGTGRDTLVGSAVGQTHFFLDDIGAGDKVTGGGLGIDTLSVGDEAKYNVAGANGFFKVNNAVVSSVSDLYIDSADGTKVNIYGSFGKSGLDTVTVTSDDGFHHINAGGAAGLQLVVEADGGHGIINGSKSGDIFRISDINADDQINGHKGFDSLTLRTGGTDVQTIAIEGLGGGQFTANGGFVANVESVLVEGGAGGDRIILTGNLDVGLTYVATGTEASIFSADDVTSGVGFHATGAEGNDILVGGLGADILVGSGGGDVLIGGAGDDALYGALEADPLAEDNASDLFVFETGSGHDDVYGFGVNDLIDLTDYGLTYADLLSGGQIASGAGFVDITLTADDSIRVHVDSLDVNDFLYA